MASRYENAFANPMGGGAAGGHTAFGTVPAPIGVAPNVFSQVGANVPKFGALTGGASDVVGSELSGEVSPATMKALQNAAATFGVTSGMPGSGLQKNSLFANVAGFSENRQRQGLQDYLATLSGVGHTMTDPALATEVASRNAMMASAPDPKLAAERQMEEWMMKFNLTNGPGGGTGTYGGGPMGGQIPTMGPGKYRPKTEHFFPNPIGFQPTHYGEGFFTPAEGR